MGWITSTEAHADCRPPIGDVPQSWNWIGYWECDICGRRFKVMSGVNGAASIHADGTKSPGISWQEIEPKEWRR